MRARRRRLPRAPVTRERPNKYPARSLIYLETTSSVWAANNRNRAQADAAQ